MTKKEYKYGYKACSLRYGILKSFFPGRHGEVEYSTNFVAFPRDNCGALGVFTDLKHVIAFKVATSLLRCPVYFVRYVQAKHKCFHRKGVFFVGKPFEGTDYADEVLLLHSVDDGITFNGRDRT